MTGRRARVGLVADHWVLGVGDLRPELRATADLLGVELTEVGC